jgi:hypothetical protein
MSAATATKLINAFEISAKAYEMATTKVLQSMDTENLVSTTTSEVMDAAAATANAAGYSSEETKDIIANAAVDLVAIFTGTNVDKLTPKEKMEAGYALLCDSSDAISAANRFLFECEEKMKAAHAAMLNAVREPATYTAMIKVTCNPVINATLVEAGILKEGGLPAARKIIAAKAASRAEAIAAAKAVVAKAVADKAASRATVAALQKEH